MTGGDLMQNNSPIDRIIAVSDKLPFAIHFYICQKVEQWLKSGGDPQGEYMVHLAEYAEKMLWKSKFTDVCDFEGKEESN